MSLYEQYVSAMSGSYSCGMPRLWNETITAHRHAVRETVLDTTWALVTEHGLRAVSMAGIAEAAGLGRATLYKYFPDVDAILTAWHRRQISAHLEQLAALAEGPGGPDERLEAVLTGYAHIAAQRGHHGPELAALLHRGEHLDHAETELVELFAGALAGAAEAGQVRDDIAPDELARYCRHALGAAAALPSPAAADRLVAVTLAGLRPPAGAGLRTATDGHCAERNKE